MSVRELLSGSTAGFLSAADAALLPEARDPRVWETPEIDAVLERAEWLSNEPNLALPFSSFVRFFQDGDRQEYEHAYFARRRRLNALALAVLSGRGDRYTPALENVLSVVCEEFTWALPAHLPDPGPGARTTVDLFAAETASALAEIRCLLGARMNPALAARMEAEVESRVLTPFLSDRTPWDWETATHNWAAVCGGGVGIAALWLLPSERLAAVLARLGPAFDAYLSGFPPDGICLEGMGYWTYGFGYFTAFAEVLKDRSRGKVDLLGHPSLTTHLKAIADFPRVGRLGNRDFVRFSDALEYRYPPGIAARLTERLGAPGPLPPQLAETLEFDIYARWARQLRDVLWAAPAEPPATPDSVGWYPDSQWLVVRQGSVGLAAKGGHNAEPHNHNDIGGFQLVAGDDALIDDLGAGRYDRGYFGSERYSYFVNASRSHSVPLIDAQEQRAGSEARADASYAPRELTIGFEKAYAIPALSRLVRRFTLAPESLSEFIVTDRLSFTDDQPHEVVERFVTQLPARVEGGSVVVTGRGATLTIRPEAAALSTRVVPVVYTPHEGADKTAFCLDFVYQVVGDARLSFQFTIDQHSKEL